MGGGRQNEGGAIPVEDALSWMFRPPVTQEQTDQWFQPQASPSQLPTPPGGQDLNYAGRGLEEVVRQAREGTQTDPESLADVQAHPGSLQSISKYVNWLATVASLKGGGGERLPRGGEPLRVSSERVNTGQAEMNRQIHERQLAGIDYGIPEGMVEEGLNTEHPEVANLLDKYTHEQNPKGLTWALEHEGYPHYYDDLQRLLTRSYGNKPIPVVRIEGYESGAHGQGVGDYMSVSTNPSWGQGAEQRGGKVVIGAVDPRDVVAAGNEAEGELIIKKGSMMRSGDVPMEPHEQFVKGGMTARELPKIAMAGEPAGLMQFKRLPSGHFDVVVDGKRVGGITRTGGMGTGGRGYDGFVMIGGKTFRTSSTMQSEIKNNIKRFIDETTQTQPDAL